MKSDMLNGESAPQLVKTTLLIAAVLIFIFLISIDAVKGLTRRAHWIPGDFLVLSALSIQLLNLLSSQGLAFEVKPGDNILWNEFWMIHTSRLMLCVLVAYLMPGMANPGSENFWGKVMALALTIFIHVTSELYIVHRRQYYHSQIFPLEEVSEPFYIAFATLVSISLVLLILLLGSSNIAGRGIGRMVAQKIPVVLKGQEELCSELSNEAHSHLDNDHSYHPRCQNCWTAVEDSVLRAWIVARAYSLEYIIARSVLASAAATILTFQIVITIVGVLRARSRLESKVILDWLRCTATILQCVFIFIGWFIIIWRWATAVVYYRKWQSDTWRSGLRMEDFWTRHLRELQEAKEPRVPQAEVLDTKIKGVVANEEITLTAPKILLCGVIGLQLFIVSFSKACWLTSLMFFHNKLMGQFIRLILSKHEERAFKDYGKYKELLEGVQMLGETPESLWLANRKSIAKAKKLIEQGNGDGDRCKFLVEFVANKKTGFGAGCHCLEPYKLQTELKNLCKKSPIQRTQQSGEGDEENGPLAVEEHFAVTSTKSWKMTAVSLLGIIIHLAPIYAECEGPRSSASHDFPPKAVKDCLEAYSQAWEIIDFVEETDTVADGITSQAADRYFCKLERKVKNGRLPATPESVRAALDELKKECKSKTEPSRSVKAGNDSLDWKTAASDSALYKLCSSIECNDLIDVCNLLEELESCLADIINECLEKFQNLLLLNSREWALHSDEKRMAKALYTAGKVNVIMKSLYGGSRYQ